MIAGIVSDECGNSYYFRRGDVKGSYYWFVDVPGAGNSIKAEMMISGSGILLKTIDDSCLRMNELDVIYGIMQTLTKTYETGCHDTEGKIARCVAQMEAAIIAYEVLEGF